MVEFDLQSIWHAGGMSAAALTVGYIFGFVQSAVPRITNSGVFRNYVLMAVSAAIVILAGITSGKTLDDPFVINNLLGGTLVFIGIYNLAKNAHGAGEATAQKTSHGAEISSPPTPFG